MQIRIAVAVMDNGGWAAIADSEQTRRDLECDALESVRCLRQQGEEERSVWGVADIDMSQLFPEHEVSGIAEYPADASTTADGEAPDKSPRRQE